MKSCLRLVICVFMTVLFLTPQQVSVSASYMPLISDTQAVVLQVVDGEHLRVQPVGTNQVALVRLAGVNTHGRRDSREFMTGALVGRTVELILSATNGANAVHERWTPVYLTHNGVVYNRALMQRGLAVVDPEYQGDWMYNLLVDDASRAEEADLGLWEDIGFGTTQAPRMWRGGWGFFHDERVNINTATIAQINRILDTPSSVGRDIVRFRYHTPFQNVGDVRFADRLTRDEFDDLWDLMKVTTNINTASMDELLQLIDVDPSDARAIIRFREGRWFSSIYQLRDERLISPRAFEQNRPFLAVSDVDEIMVAYPDIIVDVNTATAQELQEAGLTSSQANAVVNARVNGYTLKSIGELLHMPGVRLNYLRLHEISDNIRVFYGQDWNRWNRNLRPVFININTATRDELWHLGFNEQQVNALLARRGRMDSAHDIPFDISSWDHSVTLFTNVNRATPQEWMSLDVDMPYSFARVLSQEARHNPFGTMRELREFFYDNGHYYVYRRIHWFLTLR